MSTLWSEKVSEELSVFTEKYGHKMVTFDVWERVQYEHNLILKSKIALMMKTITVREMLVALLKELESFSKHVFMWEWQNQQFKEAQEHLPSGVLLTVMDFQQNFACEAQDEIQSAHWPQVQITIHPTVCFYRCKEHNTLVKESIIHISSDLVHDHNAVHHFVQETVEHIKETKQINIISQVQFTDGCSCQYKSRGPFSDISMSQSELGHNVVRNYFGSRHGKGPSDGEGGVIKSKVESLVKSRQAKVRTAEEFYQFVKPT